MFSKFWQVIKDDSKRTYEVCGQATSENSFMNRTYAMQRAGMNVSCVLPPVTHRNASRDTVKVSGYTKEDGLHERLLKEFREISRNSFNEFDTED